MRGAAGCFLAFLLPRADLFSGTERYVVTCHSVGYGWGWDDREAEDEGGIPEMPAGEREIDALEAGDELVISRELGVPDDEIWAIVSTAGGTKVCELPFRAVEDEHAIVRRILAEINGGRAVRGRITSARHGTYSDYGRNERVHELEFDVYSSSRLRRTRLVSKKLA